MNNTPFPLLAEIGQAALESMDAESQAPATHNSADALNEYADAIADIATDAPADDATLQATELALEHYGIQVPKDAFVNISYNGLVSVLRSYAPR